MRNALIVDDDAHIGRIVKLYLEKNGFQTVQAFDGEQALQLYGAGRYDLVILDLMLPKLDGIEVCRRIRETSDVPVIMLTAKGQVDERIEGLQTGADDYVVKPFDPNELMARAEAVLRRTGREAALLNGNGAEGGGTLRGGRQRTRHVYGSLTVDEATYEIAVNGKKIPLPRREFELLLFLAKHPNHVFTRDELIEQVWGWDFDGEDRVVDLYVKRIRQKLGQPDEGRWGIRTVWGVGYKFEVGGT